MDKLRRELKDLEQKAHEVEQKISDIRKQLDEEEWEPKSGIWCWSANNGFSRGASSENYRRFGTEYRTKEQAEWAVKQMKTHNWLLQCKLDLCPDWEPDWGDHNESKWYAWFDNENKTVSAVGRSYFQCIGGVYFQTKKQALIAGKRVQRLL